MRKMKYKKFYFGKLSPKILEHLDEEHKSKMNFLIKELEHGSWTERQIKRQKSSILPNIALYKVLMDNDIPSVEAKELVKEYSFYKAGKAHDLLATFFRIPGFFRVFRFFMRKGMAGDEIWKSQILFDDSKRFSMDVHKCLWADTCSYFDCAEICEIFCLCDYIVFGNIDKLQFKRSQTLGMNGEKCDFSFRSKPS